MRRHPFDRMQGLSQLFVKATTPLGRSFALAKTHKDLDTASKTRDAERLVLYGYHGNAEDVRESRRRREDRQARGAADLRRFPAGFRAYRPL